MVSACNKETFIFTGRTDDAEVARFDVVLGKGGSGGGNALVHVHPLVVPRGRPHYFLNGWDGDTEFTVEFRPAQQHLLFFANFARLTAEHPEWFSAKGDPDFLLISASLDTFRDHIYLARPPVFVQKLMFAALAPIARLVGYRAVVKPVHG